MNRRKFIGNTLVSAISSPLMAQFAFPHLSAVEIHGADHTGTYDSSRAFIKAIATLPQAHGHLSIPPGVYRFQESSEALFKFKDYSDLQIDGNGAVLLFEGNTCPFEMRHCMKVVVRNLTIDWQRPPFSQGEVTEAGPRWMRVNIDKQFPITGEEPIYAIGEYDRSLGLMSVNGLDLYGQVRSVRLLGAQDIRIDLNHPVSVHVGSTMVIRYRLYSNLFNFVRCEDVTIEDVTLFSAPGMGILAERGKDFRFRHLRVQPTTGSNRLLSLNADAIHLTDCQGNIEIMDCSFQGMGDDAINICSTFRRITRDVGDNTWVIEGRGADSVATWQLPEKGASIDLYDSEPLASLGSAQVIDSYMSNGKAILKIETPLPAKETMLICDSQARTSTIIANCAFRGNRARAIVAHNNVTVSKCSFYGQSLAAILLSPDTKWMEGPTVSNVEISENSFDYNYYGQCGLRRGAITVDTAHDPDSWPSPARRVNHDVNIIGNQFSRSRGAAIFTNATTQLSILRNTFDSSSLLQREDGPRKAVVLVNTDSPLFAGNTINDKEIVVAPGLEPASGATE